MSLWDTTPGKGIVNKFAVLLADARCHQHGKRDWKGRQGGTHWVDFNDAVKILSDLKKAQDLEGKILQLLINSAEYADDLDPLDFWKALGEDPKDHLSEDAFNGGDIYGAQ